MKVGDKVVFHEKVPQDDGAPPILYDRSAEVLSVIEKPLCRECLQEVEKHPIRSLHRAHNYIKEEGVERLTLRVNLPAMPPGRKEDIIVDIPNVAKGVNANEWSSIS